MLEKKVSDNFNSWNKYCVYSWLVWYGLKEQFPSSCELNSDPPEFSDIYPSSGDQSMYLRCMCALDCIHQNQTDAIT